MASHARYKFVELFENFQNKIRFRINMFTSFKQFSMSFQTKIIFYCYKRYLKVSDVKLKILQGLIHLYKERPFFKVCDNLEKINTFHRKSEQNLFKCMNL